MKIAGSFEAGCPAFLIHLEGEPFPRKAVLDTGFNGELMIPQGVAAALGWTTIGVVDYQAASSVATAFLVEGRITWFGASRRVSAMTTTADVVLVGMELLHDCAIHVHRAVGEVRIRR